MSGARNSLRAGGRASTGARSPFRAYPAEAIDAGSPYAAAVPGRPAGTAALAIGVLADDLTGALGSAARLRESGRRTEVRWEPGSLDAETEAVVVNMGTRDHGLEPRETARRWAAWLTRQGCSRLELRIDSTLRGNPDAELAGLLDGAGLTDPWVIAVPAFPDAGRSTLGGRQRAASGPDGSALDVDVSERLFGSDVALSVDLAVVDAGAGAVTRAITTAARDGQSRFVIDASAPGHLATAARAVTAVRSLGRPVVTVSPGAWLKHAGSAPGVVVIVVASHIAQTRLQLQILTAESTTHVVDACGHDERRAIPEDARIVVVETRRGRDDLRRLAERAALATVDVLTELRRRSTRLAGIVASGGHTASCLVAALDVSSLLPEGELAPLCPKARIVGGPWAGLTLVTKGGLIGGPTALSDLAGTLI